MSLTDNKIILASNSPRRRELLAGLGVDFVVDARTSFVEKPDTALPHRQIPAAMSEGKSLGFHRSLEEDEILLTSDTLVLCGDEILGKPASREDALRMLRLLSGRGHEVITAVTLRSAKGMKTLSDTAEVWFRELSEEEITHYVDNFKPFDKAGAYGIQEWIGYIGIPRIRGSFYTIMGFPTHLVWQLLNEEGR